MRDFVDAFERAERDAHSDLNPSGACDLTRAESRLLEGKESARGWALGGIERAAPTTGAELKAEAARVLVDAGFGTPFAETWLDPKWLTVLSLKHEAAAVEHVVQACVEACHRDDRSNDAANGFGVVVIAPYRPAWPSSPRDVHKNVSTVFVAAHPAAHGGDVTRALDAAERCLRENTTRNASRRWFSGTLARHRLGRVFAIRVDDLRGATRATRTSWRTKPQLAADARRDDDDDENRETRCVSAMSARASPGPRRRVRERHRPLAKKGARKKARRGVLRRRRRRAPRKDDDVFNHPLGE